MSNGPHMHAMVLGRAGEQLKPMKLPIPEPGAGELLLKVQACGICRTDLHIIDGELTEPLLPLIPGHQIIGRVVRVGRNVTGFHPGDMVGVPWLGWTCGECAYCISGRENHTEIEVFPLGHANEALAALRAGKIRGAEVLVP